MTDEPRVRADKDGMAVDQLGVRRIVRSGDYVPSTWTIEGDDASTLKHQAKGKAKPRGRPPGKRSA